MTLSMKPHLELSICLSADYVSITRVFAVPNREHPAHVLLLYCGSKLKSGDVIPWNS